MKDEILRNRFISKLKNSDPNSDILQSFQNYINETNFLQTHKAVKQTQIIQTFFQFIHPFECFQSMRLVSKKWKHAADTIRFENNNHEVFDDCVDVENKKIRKKMIANIAARLKWLYMPLDYETLPEVLDIISNHAQNLCIYGGSISQSQDRLVMQNSRKTLELIDLTNDYAFAPFQLHFQRLKQINIILDDESLKYNLENFLNMRKLDNNMPSLKIIQIMLLKDYEMLVNLISQIAPSRMLVGDESSINFFPFSMANVRSFGAQDEVCPNLKVLRIEVTQKTNLESCTTISQIKKNFPNLSELCWSFPEAKPDCEDRRDFWKSKFQDEFESNGIKSISEKVWNQRKEEFANREWWIEIA
jgi:hypothetical protein